MNALIAPIAPVTPVASTPDKPANASGEGSFQATLAREMQSGNAADKPAEGSHDDPPANATRQDASGREASPANKSTQASTSSDPAKRGASAEAPGQTRARTRGQQGTHPVDLAALLARAAALRSGQTPATDARLATPAGEKFDAARLAALTSQDTRVTPEDKKALDEAAQTGLTPAVDPDLVTPSADPANPLSAALAVTPSTNAATRADDGLAIDPDTAANDGVDGVADTGRAARRLEVFGEASASARSEVTTAREASPASDALTAANPQKPAAHAESFTPGLRSEAETAPVIVQATTEVTPAVAASPLAASSVAALVGGVVPNSNPATPTLQGRVDAQVGTPGWGNGLGQQISWMVSGAHQTAELQLNPHDLGPVQVVLTVENRQAELMFVSREPAVREAIEAALPRLREMLAESGIQLGQANVSAEQSPREPSSSPRGSQREGGESGNADAVVTPPPVARRGLVDTFA